MAPAMIHNELRRVTDRLEAITVALLSDEPQQRANLMAERRDLLANIARTCEEIERSTVTSLLRSTLSFPGSLSLLKRPATPR